MRKEKEEDEEEEEGGCIGTTCTRYFCPYFLRSHFSECTRQT